MMNLLHLYKIILYLYDMKIGETIKEYRLKRGFNQGDFAKKVGITQANLCRIEKNLNNPATETLDKISLELAIPKEFIMIKAADISECSSIPEVIRLAMVAVTEKIEEEIFLIPYKSSK